MTDTPRVDYHAGVVPEHVRSAIRTLDNDLAVALLVVISRSGQTRFTWLRQDLHVPNQEIVQTLGQLYEEGLIERTTAGRDEGQETAYVISEFGSAVLEALSGIPERMAERRSHVPDSDSDSDSDTDSDADSEISIQQPY